MNVMEQARIAPTAAPPGRAEGGSSVRSDLEHVFRAAYPRVVGVAARVLGSRNEAEDVAQEVFLAFARTSVPAGQAPGWLSVAAAHAALNHLRSGRRRSAREEHAGDGDAVSLDIVDAIVTQDERRRVRAALARLPHPARHRHAASAAPQRPGSGKGALRRAGPRGSGP